MIKLPKILEIPPKLYPFIFNFNMYVLFLLEGGRGSAKTQSVARFILYLCEKRKIRVCAGRVIKDAVKESVQRVFAELVEEFKLDFDVSETRIIHRKTGSLIFFKGFREQEITNAKGLQGVDILWIDEAETVTKRVIDVIVPTIRKQNSVIIFTMNRYVKSDAVYTYCKKHPKALCIHIDYFENPFCPQKLIDEAEACKKRNMSDYNHIWRGLPLEQGLNYLIASEKIENAKVLTWNKERHPNNSIMMVDFAASGADLNVAKKLEQRSLTVWEETETITWSEADTDITKGKVMGLYAKWNPTFLIGDGDGLGYPIMCSLKNSLKNVVIFRGALSAKRIAELSGNARADGYLCVKEMLECEFLKLNCENTCRQLEYMKTNWNPKTGKIYIQDKKEIRKEQKESPDHSDTLMMGVYGIYYHLPYFLNRKETESGNYRLETDYEPYDY